MRIEPLYKGPLQMCVEEVIVTAELQGLERDEILKMIEMDKKLQVLQLKYPEVDFLPFSEAKLFGFGKWLRFPFQFLLKKSNTLPVLEEGEDN